MNKNNPPTDSTSAAPTQARLGTGDEGFDSVLHGGFPANRLYLLEGDPGTGKTTLALKFLLEGAAQGEPVLYVTLSETKEELCSVAASHGWSLDQVNIYELVPDEESLKTESQYTVFHPWEVELGETTNAVLEVVERTQPRRVVFDSLSEMRLLARDPLRYRRQILALKQYFAGRQCTVLLLDDRTSTVGDLQVQSIAHGVVELEHLALEYGAERRRLRVVKLRVQVDVSYLADTVLMLRYFEAGGAVRRAISVVKKRTGHHENTIREMRMSSNGISVGKPLSDFLGVLTGVPVYGRGPAPLLEERDEVA